MVVTQRNHANPSVGDIESQYRVPYFFTFLDHALDHLNARFSADLQNALIATYFVPQKQPSLTSEVIAKLKSEFEQVLPYPSELDNDGKCISHLLSLIIQIIVSIYFIPVERLRNTVSITQTYIQCRCYFLFVLLEHAHVKVLSALCDDSRLGIEIQCQMSD